MYRFFVPRGNIEEEAGVIRIKGADVTHIRSVLRMKPGEELLLCTGDPGDLTDYLCRIDSYETCAASSGEIPGNHAGSRGQTRARSGCLQIRTVILEKRRSLQELPAKLFLFQGLPKGDKMDSVIQKSVELGAAGVIPVVMRRSVVKLDESRAGKKTDRWNTIARSAAEQSKRGVIPKVEKLLPFDKAVRMAESMDHILVPYEEASGIAHTWQALSSVRGGETCGIFIGPEGGFSEEEICLLKAAGADIITLGHRILRAETAGPALLAALMLMLEKETE